MPIRDVSPPIYFISLELENVRCFGTTQVLDLSDGKGRPAQWTLLLGENGLGKTTLLQCLGWMRLELTEPADKRKNNVPQSDDETLYEGFLQPAILREENEVFEGLLRTGGATELELKASLYQDPYFKFINNTEKKLPASTSKKIPTDIKFYFSDEGVLKHYKFRKTKIQTLGEWREGPLIVAYGANRQMGWDNLAQSDLDDPIASRLSDGTELYDAEKILKDLDHAAAKKHYKGRENDQLEKVKHLLANILPDITAEGIQISPPNILESSTRPSTVLFKTFSGFVPLSALSLGYQTTLAWTMDLALRLYRRYPKSPNPMAEPAIVLIDEIDLHLHPRWQRSIMDDLTRLFPGTQFIATAHSPLIVQAAPTANLAVVQKKGGEVIIQNNPEVVHSWRVDQILTSELFSVPPRDKKTESLFAERAALLDKHRPSATEKVRLRKIQEQLDVLDTAESREDREAMNLIRDAAALLKKSNPRQQ